MIKLCSRKSTTDHGKVPQDVEKAFSKKNISLPYYHLVQYQITKKNIGITYYLVVVVFTWPN
jgi:hypothetical protein